MLNLPPNVIEELLNDTALHCKPTLPVILSVAIRRPKFNARVFNPKKIPAAYKKRSLAQMNSRPDDYYEGEKRGLPSENPSAATKNFLTHLDTKREITDQRPNMSATSVTEQLRLALQLSQKRDNAEMSSHADQPPQ